MKYPFLPVVTLRRWLLPALLPACAATAAQAQNNVGVGTATPDASAMLNLSSTTLDLLTPRMLASQRNLIASPATGLLVHQTDGANGFYAYNGSAWAMLGGSGTAGTAGLKALVRTTAQTAGSNCATGSTRVDGGRITNGNGTLNAAEITSTPVKPGVAGKWPQLSSDLFYIWWWSK